MAFCVCQLLLSAQQQLTFLVANRCLLAGNTYDLAVAFRVCQLWFSNSSSEAVNAALEAMAAQVPSHKFLCLVYQIASRLGGPASRFQVRVVQIVSSLKLVGNLLQANGRAAQQAPLDCVRCSVPAHGCGQVLERDLCCASTS